MSQSCAQKLIYYKTADRQKGQKAHLRARIFRVQRCSRCKPRPYLDSSNRFDSLHAQNVGGKRGGGSALWKSRKCERADEGRSIGAAPHPKSQDQERTPPLPPPPSAPIMRALEACGVRVYCNIPSRSISKAHLRGGGFCGVVAPR
jgi:hypothetical protein